MITYYLRLQALSPLSITRHHNLAGQTNATLDHIPGATLRGSLAWHALRTAPELEDDATFHRLFDEDGMRCDTLYPLNAEGRGAPKLALPLPLTARTCKQKPGFAAHVHPNKQGHGVSDTLIAALEESAAARLQSQGQKIPEEFGGLAKVETCSFQACGAELKRFGGYYQRHDVATAKLYQSVAPPTRVHTRTAIADRLEIAQAGRLFAREAIESGQEFAGYVEVVEDAVAWFEGRFQEGLEIEIGAGRTYGMGRMRIETLDRQSPAWTSLTLAARRQQFEARLPAWLKAKWTLVPFTLISDSILLDAWLRYNSAMTPAVLNHYADLEQRLEGGDKTPLLPPDTELFLAVTQTRSVAAWRTGPNGGPRSDDVASIRGSVFVLASAPESANELWSVGEWWERQGVGERRAEGFGRLLVAHPFHLESSAL